MCPDGRDGSNKQREVGRIVSGAVETVWKPGPKFRAQIEYDATLWAQRDAQREKRFEEKVKRQAQQLGYQLAPMEEKPAA